MGACSSCLGLGRRDSHDHESARLLDDDLYQSSYGYGALNQASQSGHPDAEFLKREREALDAICQRALESVVDIWSLHPQPHLLPKATLHSSLALAPRETATRASSPEQAEETPHSPQRPHSRQAPERPTTAPKRWGEVVINPHKKRSRPCLNLNDENGRDVFGVLQVT